MTIQKRTLTVRFGRSENANTPNTVEVTVMALASVSDTVSNVTFIGGPQTRVVLLANDTNIVTFSLVPSDAVGMTEPIKYRIAWRERFIGRQYTYDFYMPDADSEFADLEMLPPSGTPSTGGNSPTVAPTPDFIYASEISDATTVGQALIKAVDALAARTAIGATATGNILITAASATAAITALTGTQTAGRYLRSDGTTPTLSAIQAADVPTLNQNTTGTAANVTGTVAVANGGTGATTLTGLVKGSGTTAFTAATAGIDYVAPGGVLGTPSSGVLTNATGLPISGVVNLSTSLAAKQDTANKGVANGYASLDSGGKVPVTQLPSSIMEYQGVWNASTNTPTLANGTGSTGDVYRVSVAGTSLSITFEVGDYIIYNGSTWEKSDTTDAVATVAGKTGNVTLTSSDVGLGNVDNTSDATKNAAAAALTNKTSITSTGAVTGNTLVSTVATGTAPLTVSSTTTVANLSAASIGGYSPNFAANANTMVLRDSSANAFARNFINNVESTVAAGGSSALTIANAPVQYFSGNGSHTLQLPTTGVNAGARYTIINQQSTGSVALQSSTGAAITSVPAQYAADCTALTTTPTTAAQWRVSLWTQTAGVVATTSNTLAAFNASTTNAIGVGTIELGHATDTTLSRSAAGTLAVEGVDVVTITGTQTLTNKTLTTPKINSIYDTTNSALVANFTSAASAVNYLVFSSAAGTAYPGITAAGTAADAGIWLSPKGTGPIGIYSPTGQSAKFQAGGPDANHDLTLNSKGTGVVQANGVPIVTTTGTQTLTNKTLTAPRVDLLADTNGNILLSAYPAASAVNYVQIANGATGAGAAVGLYAVGSDADVTLNLYAKGAGGHNLRGGNGGVAFQVLPSSTGVNYLRATSTATGSSPGLACIGNDADLNLLLASKGTGTVQANGVPVVTTTGTQTLTNKTLTTPVLSTATPASATATGTTGTIVWDANYVYIAVATNTWKRAAITTW